MWNLVCRSGRFRLLGAGQRAARGARRRRADHVADRAGGGHAGAALPRRAAVAVVHLHDEAVGADVVRRRRVAVAAVGIDRHRPVCRNEWTLL